MLALSQVIGADTTLSASLDVGSEAIVPGATFSLIWKSDNLLADTDNLGTIKVACEISF